AEKRYAGKHLAVQLCAGPVRPGTWRPAGRRTTHASPPTNRPRNNRRRCVMTATLSRRPTETTAVPAATRARTGADVDRGLLTRMRAGDRVAWGELYQRHRGTVAGYVRARIAVDADYEDLVSEAFLRAWAKPEDYQPEQGHEVRSWLCAQAGRALLDYTRKD